MPHLAKEVSFRPGLVSSHSPQARRSPKPGLGFEIEPIIEDYNGAFDYQRGDEIKDGFG